jgi:hypothetical protein
VRGAVIAGHGGKRLLWRSDGVCVVKLTCMIKTHDEHLLLLTGRGYRHTDDERETLTLSFEADERNPYAWLARTAFIARGREQDVLEVAAIL